MFFYAQNFKCVDQLIKKPGQNGHWDDQSQPQATRSIQKHKLHPEAQDEMNILIHKHISVHRSAMQSQKTLKGSIFSGDKQYCVSVFHPFCPAYNMYQKVKSAPKKHQSLHICAQ